MRPSPRRALLHVVALGSLIAVVAPEVRGQDRATAQQLFEEGKALMARKQFSEACPKFEGAAKLVTTPGVRLNLADCYEQSGRFASAWAAFDDAAAAAERSGDAAAAREADVGKRRVAPKRSFLIIDASAATQVAGLEIRRDGTLVPSAAWGADTPVDPGDHEVSAAAPGRKPWSTKVAITAAASRETVAVPTLDSLGGASAAGETHSTGAAVPAGTEQPSADHPGSTQRTLAYVAGGIGLVGLGAGTYFALQSHSKRTDSDALCPGGTCRASTPEELDALRSQVDSLDSSATSNGRLAVISFGVGAAGLITGVTLLVLAPKSSDSTATSRSVQPLIGYRSVGVTGTF